MTRTVVALILIFATSGIPGQEKPERQSWLVATDGPPSLLLDARHDIGELGPFRSRQELASRTTLRFRHVRGFVAEMTVTEARALEALPHVRWVEPNRKRHLLATASVPPLRSSAQRVPFGISMIRAPEVWHLTKGTGVKVGVIDTGIDKNHPDLAKRYRGGHDFLNDDDDPQDDNGHGTHVAGTIAAIDNDFGVVGVAPETEIYALKVLDASGSGSVSALVEAVEWAIDHDLDVINLSLGSEDSSLLEKEAFDLAEQAGIIAVAATGNAYSGFDRIDYPANYDSVVAVGAIDFAELIAPFSQRGANLDFVALGVGVESTIFSTFYGITTADGTMYRGQLMEFSPSGTVTGELVDCGIGVSGGCPPEVSGNIALIRRGELTFAEKSENAKAAGAEAVVVYNHHDDSAAEGGVIFGTLGSPGEWVLTIGTSRSAGEALIASVDRTVTLAETSGSDYARLNGTSMATPHVAGAAAILKALAPGATKFQIIESLRSSAKDLGDPGRDNTFGHGRIDLEQAARRLAPEAFPVEGPRRRSIRRPPGD